MKHSQLFLINREPNIAKVVRDATHKCGCELFEAEDSEAALRILKEHGLRFSLVIVSLDPELHGLTFVAGIKDLAEKVPVIALTDATHTGEAQALAYGAVETISRPVHAGQLEEIVRRFCSSQHSSSA
jgi:DNA-binding NtrC family response regulator